MASTPLPSSSAQPPPSPYSFPVVPSPGPISPEGGDAPLAAQQATQQSASPESNRRQNLSVSPMSNGSPPISPFSSQTPALILGKNAASRTPYESRYDSVDSTYSDGDGMPAPLPFLKTAMSSRGYISPNGNGIADGDLPSNRLTSAKRTVSWADLTNTGTALTQVKEYQPECPPASPLSDSSWEHARSGCLCSIM
ncbi:hypothetical protein Ndes2526B_g07128 [Nannochloris sp. 'desiccata']|nr:hypothetical protein KSW81_004821 [Chlorella desiccata (nom. nud.)]KAH7618209.1 hypothetical protein NADE_000407 [Chlorella desiccata (nom. nud.)]